MNSSQNPNIYTVSKLNNTAKSILESGLGVIWLTGEISNLTIPVSGHWYFTLKDARSQVSCAMFKGNNNRAGFLPKHGQQVLVRAKATLYEPRGNYQIIVESMKPEGDGLLKQEFEELKCKLAASGLFSQTNKKMLPKTVNTVGVITSKTGAALHDILSVLKRRDPRLKVIVYPSQVQGAGSAVEIANKINLANERNECDILIVGRGGGSLEDLWSFNEEVVAYAIYNSLLPIISAVGHEIDVTIADFVADLRAATPSAAAELVSQNAEFHKSKLVTLTQELKRAMLLYNQKVEHKNAILYEKLLSQDPRHILEQQNMRSDELSLRLTSAMLGFINAKKHKADFKLSCLLRNSPDQEIKLKEQKITQLQRSLNMAMENKLDSSKEKLQGQISKLNAVSPLATLARGYSIVKDHKGRVIKDSDKLNKGDLFQVQFEKGKLEAKVI